MRRGLLTIAASTLLAAPAWAQEVTPPLVAGPDGNVTQELQGVAVEGKEPAAQGCLRRQDTGAPIACATFGTPTAIVPIEWPVAWDESYVIDAYGINAAGVTGEAGTQFRRVSRPKDPSPPAPRLLP